jgi:NAD(P)H-hydrate epimerase
LAECFQAVVVLKGRYTLIGTPGGEVLLNTTGNPGMATGGSGDTLAGIVAGLLAQGFGQHALEPDEVRDLVALGVTLHGLAGDLAAETFTQAGLLASDITAHLPKAILQLEAST